MLPLYDSKRLRIPTELKRSNTADVRSYSVLFT